MSKLRYKLICRGCSEIYDSKRVDGIFCSRKCHDTKYHRHKNDGVCVHCGVPFVTSRKVKRYCSRKCKNNHKNKDHRKYWLSSKYGLSIGEYEKLLSYQGGVCAICKQPSPSGKNLHVDHNHMSGTIRSLLCSKCNSGLGFFNDDPKLLLEAAKYLDKKG